MGWFSFGKERPKSETPAFVKNAQEFLSIWAIAHAWEGLDPASTDPQHIPASIQAHMDMIMLAYFRKELTLRHANGYKLIGHHWIHALLGLDKDFEKLWNFLSRKRLPDKDFLDNLFVMRSEILRWCEGEFRNPPTCWERQTSLTQAERAGEDADDSENWYDKITPQRKERIACLEVAKHLWEQNPELLYEQVRMHPVMDQAGLRYVFNAETFKKWARPIAPIDAKRGGRRPQSGS